MALVHRIEDTIGHTPLVVCHRIMQAHGLACEVLVKPESFNPGGSAKDRAAFYMIHEAERSSKLLPGGMIIEPTSGNTGIGLALIAACRGYRATIVMPDTMSVERQRLMQAFGARVILSDGALGMQGAIDLAQEIAEQNPGSFVASQFSNPANALAHEQTTGPEIWQDCEGQIDALVCGIGTGGTITGCGRYLKAKKADLFILGVEPSDSAVLSGGKAAPHALQGLGAGFVPELLDTDLVDEIMPVTTQQAFAAARTLGRQEGILAGISSGAAMHAALELAKRESFRGKRIVCILPDTGERYLSSPLFEEETDAELA